MAGVEVQEAAGCPPSLGWRLRRSYPQFHSEIEIALSQYPLANRFLYVRLIRLKDIVVGENDPASGKNPTSTKRRFSRTTPTLQAGRGFTSHGRSIGCNLGAIYALLPKAYRDHRILCLCLLCFALSHRLGHIHATEREQDRSRFQRSSGRVSTSANHAFGG